MSATKTTSSSSNNKGAATDIEMTPEMILEINQCICLIQSINQLKAFESKSDSKSESELKLVFEQRAKIIDVIMQDTKHPLFAAAYRARTGSLVGEMQAILSLINLIFENSKIHKEFRTMSTHEKAVLFKQDASRHTGNFTPLDDAWSRTTTMFLSKHFKIVKSLFDDNLKQKSTYAGQDDGTIPLLD